MRIKKSQLRSTIRKVLLEATSGITVGDIASQYPDLWEELCDARDYDMQGYVEGSPMMNKPLGEFIQEERLNTDDTYWWRDYYGGSFQNAQLCVEVLAGEVGWERLSFSGLDFDACYQLTVKACEQFDIPVPEHLEDKAYHMDDHQAMDAALGADWMSSMRDKFRLDEGYEGRYFDQHGTGKYSPDEQFNEDLHFILDTSPSERSYWRQAYELIEALDDDEKYMGEVIAEKMWERHTNRNYDYRY